MLLSAGIRPLFVVPESEAEGYEAQNPGCAVVFHPDDLKGLPNVTQWIADAVPYFEDVLILMDDDLKFYNRFDLTSRLPKNEPFETDMMVRWLYRNARKYGHATISPTQFNNAHKEDEGKACAARSILAYHVPTIQRLGVRFDRVPSKNDYDVTLQLLRKGYANVCAYNMCHNQCGGPELPGGCTEYRNEELHRIASDRLAELHPDYVKVVMKQKPKWPFPRADVHISWKKAYNDGLLARRASEGSTKDH
jgi:hypothetical protein